MFFQPKSDKQIIQLIKSGKGYAEDDAIKYLIKNCKQKTIGYLMRQGEKDNEQLNDLFYDAIIVFIEKVRDNQFELKAEICTFLTSVANHKWMDLITRRNKLAEVEKKYLETIQHNSSEIDKDKMSFLINRLSNNCKDLLENYYIKNISFAVYAEINYLEAASVRKRHERCLNTLRELWNKK